MTGKSFSVAQMFQTYKREIGLWALIFAVLIVIAQFNYLLFHSLAEVYSMSIAFGIFALAWNARRYLQTDFLLFIGIGYLFVGFLDFFHMLAYKGMGVFPGTNGNCPTQLWIAARYMESILLLCAPFFFTRKLNPSLTAVSFAAATLLVLITIFLWPLFPDCFVSNSGLTPFKIYSEYVICLILVLCVFHLRMYADKLETKVYRLIVGSILLTIVSELAFTFYIDVFGFSNLVGHLLKILSFYLVYSAIIEVGLKQPYDLLFRDLSISREELLRVNRQLKELVNIDALTKIANRRHFDETLHREWKQMVRTGQPLSLIMIDLDFFKEYNDAYGHQAGDECLQTVALMLNQQISRPSDLVARYGGEEFAVILPDTDAVGAHTIAKRLQTTIEKLAIVHDFSKVSDIITMSFGIASSYPNPAVTEAGLIRTADEALYEAKHSGRARIIIHDYHEQKSH